MESPTHTSGSGSRAHPSKFALQYLSALHPEAGGATRRPASPARDVEEAVGGQKHGLNPDEPIWDIMSLMAHGSIHQCHVAPQTVQEGGHAGAWRPHTLLNLILTCSKDVTSKSDQPVAFFYLNFKCDSKSRPPGVNKLDFH